MQTRRPGATSAAEIIARDAVVSTHEKAAGKKAQDEEDPEAGQGESHEAGRRAGAGYLG